MSGKVDVSIVIEPHGEGLPLPAYESDSAAGMDLRAAVEGRLTVAPGQRALIPTGIRIALPTGTEGQVRPRSGLAAEHGIGILNSPGTIDADYRGEIRVILVNLGDDDFVIERGDRIAQLVIAPVLRASWKEAASLNDTGRGEGGFGHTGV